MAEWAIMDVDSLCSTGGPHDIAYYKNLSLNSPGSSVWVLIPEGIDIVSVMVIPAGGASAIVEYTLERSLDVKEGVPVYMEWPLGEVTEISSDFCVPVTAIRLTQKNSGTARLKMRAQ